MFEFEPRVAEKILEEILVFDDILPVRLAYNSCTSTREKRDVYDQLRAELDVPTKEMMQSIRRTLTHLEGAMVWGMHAWKLVNGGSREYNAVHVGQNYLRPRQILLHDEPLPHPTVLTMRWTSPAQQEALVKACVKFWDTLLDSPIATQTTQQQKDAICPAYPRSTTIRVGEVFQVRDGTSAIMTQHLASLIKEESPEGEEVTIEYEYTSQQAQVWSNRHNQDAEARGEGHMVGLWYCQKCVKAGLPGLYNCPLGTRCGGRNVCRGSKREYVMQSDGKLVQFFHYGLADCGCCVGHYGENVKGDVICPTTKTKITGKYSRSIDFHDPNLVINKPHLLFVFCTSLSDGRIIKSGYWTNCVAPHLHASLSRKWNSCNTSEEKAKFAAMYPFVRNKKYQREFRLKAFGTFRKDTDNSVQDALSYSSIIVDDFEYKSAPWATLRMKNEFESS